MPKKRNIIPYNSELKDLASQLRKNMTLSEVLLWIELKNKQMLGYDFDRQIPIGDYIVDFYCKDLNLAVEIDGDTHIFKYDDDEVRQRNLEKLGVHFLRFEDLEVKKSMGNVLRVIEDWIEKREPTPNPSEEGILKGRDSAPTGERSLKRTPNSQKGIFGEPTPNPSQEGILKGQDSAPTGERSLKTTPNSQKGIFGEHTPNPFQEGILKGQDSAPTGERSLKTTPNSQKGIFGEPTPNPSEEGILKGRDSAPTGERSLKRTPNSQKGIFGEPTPGPSEKEILKGQDSAPTGERSLKRTPNSQKGIFGEPTPNPSQEGIPGGYISAPVFIGQLPLGGTHPVLIQSMTNTDTLDTKASVAQCIRIIEAGADLVRLTAQGIKEAENLANIRSELRKAGFETPLIADIHFNPSAAEHAARIVEKVRVNPGNYADKRASFIKVGFSEQEYKEELERIHSRILPLINICHEHHTAVRIGVNHGSLSDRIMTRYGNTPEGMAVSAMEFIRIFRAENFHKLVLSMKSSDTGIMIRATRRLVELMKAEGFAYPLHLGVTEAGEGEDGRIRSAAGIGALLSEGIGDTIRVSLSEAPEKEIPVAKEILNFLAGSAGRVTNPDSILNFKTNTRPYKPEVVTNKNGKFSGEKNQCYNNVITLSKGNFPPLEVSNIEDIVLNGEFSENDPERLAIDSAALLGRYFITRQAGGICITNKGKIKGDKLKELSFSILQATGARITRVIYLSCPTCGRTRFDLQEAVREVKAMTGHLTGLKIAVMGCIVNGPGEMADADYGYVGAGNGKVHIYRGTSQVLKNIPQEMAAKELLRLIEDDLRNR